jgi:hypothetical protein
MTRDTGAPGPGIPRLWFLPFGVIAGIGAAGLAGVLSRSVFLDLVAWWPAWLALFGLAWWARDRRLGHLRASGLVALLGLLVTLAFLVGHLQGWLIMPSASGHLVGPVAADFPTATLEADIHGRLVVDGGGEYLYEAEPVRWGGDVGLPEGFEETGEGSIHVILRPATDPGLQSFAGWQVRLSPDARWDLDLSGALEADLSGLDVAHLAVAGSGVVTIGETTGATEAEVTGDLTIAVPAGAPVKVVGEATVPGGWEGTDDGWEAPVPGVGWVIAVAPGARVVFTTPG